LSQNEDPQICEQTIYGRIADTYLGLGETDKAVELWKAHNAGGVYNSRIGSILAQNDQVEEAVPYLSEALANLLADLITTINGYVNVYLNHGDHASAQAILHWGISLLQGLREGGKPNYFDRVSAVLLVALAGSQHLSGQGEAARDTLKKAKELAAFFDASPSYDESDIRFVGRIEGASAYDDLGATAMDGVRNAVSQFENEEFTALWSAVSED
jgi:tetratricopeptide (TPR) repeat protein